MVIFSAALVLVLGSTAIVGPLLAADVLALRARLRRSEREDAELALRHWLGTRS